MHICSTVRFKITSQCLNTGMCCLWFEEDAVVKSFALILQKIWNAALEFFYIFYFILFFS